MGFCECLYLAPSGKFCIPIPKANIIAAINIEGSLTVNKLANATPIAIPSGILCKVIAENINIDLLLDLIFLFDNNLFKKMSAKIINSPPKRNPIDTTNQLIISSSFALSIAGFNNEKKLLEIIIPAPKAKKQSNIFFDTFLNNSTVQEPNKFIK